MKSRIPTLATTCLLLLFQVQPSIQSDEKSEEQEDRESTQENEKTENDSSIEERLNELVKKLDAEEMETREKARGEILELGEPTIELLKAKLKEELSVETRDQIESILHEIDWPEGGPVHKELQMVCKISETEFDEGSDILLHVRITNLSKKDKELDITSDGLKAASDMSVRIHLENEHGSRTAIGTFNNFNKGPAKYSVSFEGNSQTKGDVQTFLGTYSLKGDRRTTVKPGTYKIYAVLGDRWGPYTSTGLESNAIEITIKKDEEKPEDE